MSKMKKEEIIQQGKEFLKNSNFKAAEDVFRLLISVGENGPEVLELKGDSLYGQVRIGYAQICYHDAIDKVMTEIYDSIKSSKTNDNLKTNYERLLKKLVNTDVRLYPEYDDLISKIQKENILG